MKKMNVIMAFRSADIVKITIIYTKRQAFNIRLVSS